MNLTHFNRAFQQKLINYEQFTDAESGCCHFSFYLLISLAFWRFKKNIVSRTGQFFLTMADLYSFAESWLGVQKTVKIKGQVIYYVPHMWCVPDVLEFSSANKVSGSLIEVIWYRLSFLPCHNHSCRLFADESVQQCKSQIRGVFPGSQKWFNKNRQLCK